MAAILTYRPAHFESVRALWEEAFPNDPPRNRAEASIPAKLAEQPDLLFVAVDGAAADDDAAVVGTVMAGYDGHRGWLYSVAVRADRRRSGIATALVQHAEAALKARGCVKVNLQVRTTNRAVIRFYEALGYAVEDHVSLGKPF